MELRGLVAAVAWRRLALDRRPATLGGVEAKVKLPRAVRVSRGSVKSKGSGRRIASVRSDTRPEASAAGHFFRVLQSIFLRALRD